MSVSKEWEALVEKIQGKLMCRGVMDKEDSLYDILTDFLRGDLNKMEAIEKIKELYKDDQNGDI